jgi:hypothetical protein
VHLSNERLDDAAERWREEMRVHGAKPCPVCNHTPQLRQHVFTATMALALIHLYHRGGPAEAGSIPELVKTGESLKKLVLWGYATQRGDAFSLTKSGLAVVVRQEAVPVRCVAAHGQALWFAAESVYIDDTLSQRYSYDDLMREGAA